MSSPYVSPISDKFQAKFNEFAGKRGLVDKKEIEKFANQFYVRMRMKAAESDHCPFPEALAYYYKNLKNGK